MDRLYEEYVRKKKYEKTLASRGKTTRTDSQRTKLYTAESKFEQRIGEKNIKFESLEECQRYVNRITKSKTWKKINETRHFSVVVMKQTRRCNEFWAYAWPGFMELSPRAYNQYTILHELGHCAGMGHHDVGFREKINILVSRFMGVEAAKLWRSTMKEHNLRIKRKPIKILEYEEWLEMKNKMDNIRKMRENR